MGRYKKPYRKIARNKWAKEKNAEFWEANKENWKKGKLLNGEDEESEEEEAEAEEEEEEEEVEEEEEEEKEEKEEEEEDELAEINEQGPETDELMKEKYRCRSAYKLIEINDKYKIFKPGQVVVDLGCCPGSWTQVAVLATRAQEERFNSLVVGLDIKETEPIEGAHLLNELDFLEKSSQKRIKKVLDKRRADVVLSDMAPNTTGIRFIDHTKVTELCDSILRFVPKVAKHGATLVMKAFDGGECKQLIRDIRHLFERGIVVHPKATRKPSSEFFYVGLKYRANKLPPRQEEPEPPKLLPKALKLLQLEDLSFHDPWLKRK